MVEEVKEISKYNEASLQILRLHECWVRANQFLRGGLLVKWKWELDVIWLELFSDVKKTKIPKDIKKNNKDHREKIAENTKNPNKLYEALYYRHEFLKELQTSVGKGGVYVDEMEGQFE